jgi:hypothetical protein
LENVDGVKTAQFLEFLKTEIKEDEDFYFSLPGSAKIESKAESSTCTSV